MWETGRWPAANTFSFAVPDYPYIDLHWVFQIALYAVYRLGGVNGCIALAIVLVLATTALVYATAVRHAPPIVVAPVLVLALTIASPRFVPRPELVSFALLGAYLWILERRPIGRSIYLLVPLQVLWVNSHGLFAVGLVLIGCYWLGATLAFLRLPRGWRQESGLHAAGMGASHRGARAGRGGVSAESLRRPRRVVPAGVAPESHRRVDLFDADRGVAAAVHLGYARELAWAWVVLLAAAALSFVLNLERWHLGRLLAVVAFGVLSTQALRNMSVFAWVAVAGIAGNLGVLVNRRTEAAPSRAARRRGASPSSGRGRRFAESAMVAAVALLLALVVTNRFSLASASRKSSAAACRASCRLARSSSCATPASPAGRSTA